MTINCHSIRKQFPVLEKGGLIYLDSAASSLKPSRVLKAMSDFALEHYANIHRGTYNLSMESTKLYEESKHVVREYIGATSWREIIYTSGSTSAIHLASLILLYNGIIRRKSNIVITEAEHHSNMIPWYRVARLVGAEVRVLPVDNNGVPKWDDLETLIDENTSVVAFAHISNVTGAIAPVKEITRYAHEKGALVLLDGAQSVPHIPVNVKDLEIDMLVFSGHKMLGPTGIGVLWMRKELAEELEPPLGGGGTIKDVFYTNNKALNIEWDEPPWKFESGTPPIIEAIGLMEAIKLLLEVGLENIARHEALLTKELIENLTKIKNIKIIGPENHSHRKGIVTFIIKGANPDIVGLYLNMKNIAVRTGLHCAHPLHHKLGLESGSIRASFYLYNCLEDVYALVNAVKEFVKNEML